MTIEKKVNGDTAELYLDGWLDAQNVPVLEEALNGLESNVKYLVLDLSKLEYTSSAGLRQFVAAYQKMNGEMKLRHVSDEVKEVLDMVGLSSRLTIEA